MGPAGPAGRGPRRLRRGGGVLAPGDGTGPVQVIDARDLAE